jgi:hypothetical protein
METRRTPISTWTQYLATLLLLSICFSSYAVDINGRCYPHPMTLGVNEQPPEDAALIRRANLGWVRITIPWRDINPGPGVYVWGGMDELIEAHYERGTKILAVLSTAPGIS